MTIDREALGSWYRQAMGRRIEELRSLRDGLSRQDVRACDRARAVGQALRGSGATFGFPQLSAVASLVETSSDQELPRRVEGLIEQLRSLADPERPEGAVSAEWLALAAGLGDARLEAFPSLETAWKEIAGRSKLAPDQLAGRVARTLGIATANLSSPARAALRLIPESLIRAESILPVREDAETITVATSDPTSLAVEEELGRLTARTPVMVVASPPDLHQALMAVLDAGESPKALPLRRAVVAGDGAPGKVLVVDDDTSSRLLARTVLEKRGYDVVEAVDGVQALKRLEADQPVALVVADLNMPNMDGLELIWEMRAQPVWAHIPVIVLTGETDEVLETRLIEEGADDYVCKPLDPRLFLARVGATIRRADD